MDPQNSEFARLIQESGWTHEHAAAQLGLHRGTISHIVTGKQRVSYTALRLLAELTGSSIRLPGRIEGSKGLSEGATPYSATGWEHDLIINMRRLPKAKRDSVIDVAKWLVIADEPTPKGERFKSDNLSDFTSEVPDDQQTEEPLPELPLVPEPTGKWAKAYGPHQPPKFVPPPSGGPPPLSFIGRKPPEKKDKPQ